MYAIVETGGKQYKVAQGDTILAELLSGQKGKDVALEKVLLVQDGKKLRVGTPYLAGAKVLCECLGEEKGVKTINFKYRRRKGYRRKVGHRQKYVRLKIQELVVP